MAEQIERTVTKLVAKHLQCEPDAVSPDLHLITDLRGDSLGLVQLHLALEEEFDLEIDDAAALTLVTVGDIVTFLATAMGR